MAQVISQEQKKTTEATEIEIQRCLLSLESVMKSQGVEQGRELVQKLANKLHQAGIEGVSQNTPYINTIDKENEPEYPGDLQMERRIKSYIRWNAMAMVVSGNADGSGVGGHISTYASCATIYEVGFNHFFKGQDGEGSGDQIYFQGHASPGNYGRAFLEGRLTTKNLHNFRRELTSGGGLSSYPHPYLMPDFWQFPTVSMGLGPLLSIYQARFNRYMDARGFVQNDSSRVWAFVGDGESDEPETLGAISLAGRERLDNLTWIVNCNLQSLDGPVRGNGKIIQDLEGVFRGAGWNVIKVVWGSDWDEMLKSKHKDLLIKRMEETLDGDYQRYTVSPGSHIRKHFFGKYPELLELVDDYSDDELKRLLRGGHDSRKVYAAFKRAVEHKGQPTVILAKTVKGYGLGEAGEGKNVSHQQKKMNEKELREFRVRFNIPIGDEEIAETPFYRPADDSEELKYLHSRRKALGGYLPIRDPKAPHLNVPDLSYFDEFLKGSGDSALSTTMAYVRLLTKLLRHKEVGKNVVPIIPDEARTFGMEALFRQFGIYSSRGQQYEPADSDTLLYYKQAVDGQLLEEGINEAGSMASFIAAGTSYSTHHVNMIPFYTYYSMFGYQRVGDMFWLAGDIRAKGFLVGATAGRTTLNGEGLQHQDGHSHLISGMVPSCICYDVAFAYELAVIVQDGLRRMYRENENVFYYLTVHNENYEMPPMPEGVEQGILKGLYKFKEGLSGKKHKVQLFGSGAIIKSALKAQHILEDYDVSVDVWSVTNYNQLRREALACQRHNMLHPDEEPQTSYLEDVLKDEQGTFVAVSDNVKLQSDQIAQWVPGGLFSLGTDGFGRSETREKLRRFFEVDVECTVVGVLYALQKKGAIDAKTVKKVIEELGVNPDKDYPVLV